MYMPKDIRKLILDLVKKQGEARSSQVVEESGFSRVYVNRFFRQLVAEGKLQFIGKANLARYVAPGKANLVLSASRLLKNKNLNEDIVLQEIQKTTDIFKRLSDRVKNIVAYSFSEMLNNAIEHSRSKKISIQISRTRKGLNFIIRDYGVGVFKNVMKNFDLKDELEAISHLLKGKQTTVPSAHSGEGIFFTSKAADLFILESFGKRLTVDNIIQDVLIKDIKSLRGTRVTFNLSSGSKKNLTEIFRAYTTKGFDFSKTKVLIKLGIIDSAHLSRSEARRIMFGLDKYKEIILDFKGVDTVGQAFADEIFRVWQSAHQEIKIIAVNTSENARFMISRTLSNK
jgi:anti-sigma regulatory factor (Ser/Thr protein kinase)